MVSIIIEDIFFLRFLPLWQKYQNKQLKGENINFVWQIKRFLDGDWWNTAAYTMGAMSRERERLRGSAYILLYPHLVDRNHQPVVQHMLGGALPCCVTILLKCCHKCVLLISRHLIRRVWENLKSFFHFHRYCLDCSLGNLVVPCLKFTHIIYVTESSIKFNIWELFIV